MGKLIGKRIRVQIGGKPLTDDERDTVIGQDTSVYVPPEDISRYDIVIGEQVTVTFDEFTEPLRRIEEIIKNSNEVDKERILEFCKQILNESNKSTKIAKIKNLINITSDIASIGSFVAQLKNLI